jgi:predicted SAM-dependent methyltransferase
MIEHISLQDGKFMLEESFRVLKNDGKIRISTPDLKFLIELYNDNKTDLQKKYVDYNVNHPSYDVFTAIDTYVINNFVRAWGHVFIYDKKVLKDLLESVGFTKVKSYLINESEDENLKDLENCSDSVNVKYGLTPEILQLETFTLEASK